MIFCVYCRHGAWCDAFEAIAEYTDNGKIPYLIVGDFNRTPQQAAQLHTPLGRVGDNIVVANQGDAYDDKQGDEETDEDKDGTEKD